MLEGNRHRTYRVGLRIAAQKLDRLINLTRQTEPYAGLSIDVSRRSKTESETAVRVHIMFNEAEALGVGVVLEQSLGVIAFGIPKENTYTPAPRQEAEQSAI